MLLPLPPRVLRPKRPARVVCKPLRPRQEVRGDAVWPEAAEGVDGSLADGRAHRVALVFERIDKLDGMAAEDVRVECGEAEDGRLTHVPVRRIQHDACASHTSFGWLCMSALVATNKRTRGVERAHQTPSASSSES